MYNSRHPAPKPQGRCGTVCSPNSPMLAPTTAQERMITISRKETIDEIEEVQFESNKLLSLEVEAAGYGEEIASYSSMLQDAVAIYLQAAMAMDTTLALTIAEPRLSGLHMSLVSEHDRHSMLRAVLSRLPDHVSKLVDKIVLVKGMAVEYTAAIKARLPFETETADFDTPIVDIPFWSELDRLWEFYCDVRKEIDDCKRTSLDAQSAIFITHLSLDEVLSKLEMGRGFMGKDKGFSSAHAQDRDYNVTLSAAKHNHAPPPCLKWRLVQASNNALAAEESTPTSQSCPVSASGRQERLSTSRSSTSLDPASYNLAITTATPAFAARLDCSDLATGQSCGTLRASSSKKPLRVHTQEQQQEQATPLGKSDSKTCESTIPPFIVPKIQRIASHELMPTLWRYLRSQRTSRVGTRVDQKLGTAAPLEMVEDRIKRLLSRYQTEYEAFLDDDAYFPEYHRRLYLAHIYGLYNQEKMTRRQNSRQRKRERRKERRTAANGRAANRSLNDMFIDFLLPQLQKEDGTRRNTKTRFENWMALGRMCAKLVEHFGEAILVLLPPDLSNESLRTLTVRQEDAIINYLCQLEPDLKSDIQNLTTFLLQIVEAQRPPIRKLKLELLSENEIGSDGHTRRSLKELFELLE